MKAILESLGVRLEGAAALTVESVRSLCEQLCSLAPGRNMCTDRHDALDRRGGGRAPPARASPPAATAWGGSLTTPPVPSSAHCGGAAPSTDRLAACGGLADRAVRWRIRRPRLPVPSRPHALLCGSLPCGRRSLCRRTHASLSLPPLSLCEPLFSVFPSLSPFSTPPTVWHTPPGSPHPHSQRCPHPF